MHAASLPGRAEHISRGRQLEWFTVGYNCLEGILAFGAGLVAGSVALTGFGLDSGIEVASGAALLWRLQADHDPHRRAAAEARALKIVGVCFVLLAAYVTVDAAWRLVNRLPARESLVGILVAAASVIVMPVLARAKRRVAHRISSSALTADAKQTQICAYLSAILLGGLVLNSVWSWWWADPLAALCMVPIIAKEGVDALRGRTCCAHC